MEKYLHERSRSCAAALEFTGRSLIVHSLFATSWWSGINPLWLSASLQGSK